ncbi:MAG: tRNA 4-thiouridine(8) synthase ThiI [Kiritimatiellaeota bacterium]|nr:tRNA 4-thiouridine(8) synthase ThiI [Kiritimatiellota bacterium]
MTPRIDAILCRYCEIALKKGNRSMFERCLAENLRAILAEIPDLLVPRTRGRMWLKKKGGACFSSDEVELVVNRLPKAFGLASFSPGVNSEKKIETMVEAAAAISQAVFERELDAKKHPTFRIRARRSDKNFAMNSKEVEIALATALSERFDKEERLRVNLELADITVSCEIREESAFLFTETFQGPGGLPTGSNSHVLALLSGGIDSPVACSMLMKRGCRVDFITFHSYPYTTEKSVDKVRRIVEVLNEYQPRRPGKLFICNLAPLQKIIRDSCSERFRTILYRRYMFRIAEAVARRNRSGALLTGEAVGQVASQTIANLAVIDNAVPMLVLRPLTGLDKEEIIKTAKRLKTFEISIERAPDSCTVFAPKSPATTSTIQQLEKEEAKLFVDELFEELTNDAFFPSK